MSIATTAAPVGAPGSDSELAAVDGAPGSATQLSLAERVRADGVEFILALFVDLAGKPCAKLVVCDSRSSCVSRACGRRPDSQRFVCLPHRAVKRNAAAD